MLTKEMFELATKIDDLYVITFGDNFEDYRTIAYELFEVCGYNIDKYEKFLDEALDNGMDEYALMGWIASEMNAKASR